MQKELEQQRLDSLLLCDRLMVLLRENQEDANSFFAGEVQKAYDAATDKARMKVQKIRNKIKNL